MLTPRNALILSLSVSGILVLAKIWVWLGSGSSAILASAADSLSDVVVSCSGLLALLYALKPADHDHRFGHGKMEGVAALFHAAFIIGVALFVMLDSARSFLNPDAITMHKQAMILLVCAVILNAGLLCFQRAVMCRHHSLILQADHTNYTADIAMHVCLFIAIWLHLVTGWVWVDPLAAILVAVWMMIAACGIMRQSLNMLLDRELPEGQRQGIRVAILSQSGVRGVHDLRTRYTGTHLSLSFDIEVDPALSFAKAHDISKDVETALLTLHPGAEIMIHVDPAGDISDSRHQTIKQHHVE